MMYNKFNTRKTNDKKLLHKVGKQWKVVSVSLLMAIAGAGAFGATHANADATNANTDTQNTINSLEAQPKLVMPSSATSNASSSAKSNNAQSNVAPSSVSYVSGDNGSAASYHARAVSDASNASAYNTPVRSYVNSLNNEFPRQTKSLNDQLGKSTKRLVNDQDNATKYGKIVKESGYNSALAQSASVSGLDVNDYYNNVSNSAQVASNNVKNDKATAHIASLADSYANVINNINNNSDVKMSYVTKAAQAKANVSITSAFNSAAQTIESNASDANARSLKASESFDGVKLQYSLAAIRNSLDSIEVSSLASSLGFSNSNPLSADLSNYVKSYNSNATSYKFSALSSSKGKNASPNSSEVLSSGASNSSDFAIMKSVIADLHTESTFASSEVAYNNKVSNTASTLSSAVTAAAVASGNYSEAKSEEAVADALTGSISDGDIFTKLLTSSAFSNEAEAYDTVSDALTGNSNLASYTSEVSSANKTLNSDTSASNSIDSAYSVPLASYYASSYASNVTSDTSAVSNASAALTDFYNQYTNQQFGSVDAQLTKATADEDVANKLATAYGMHAYNYSPKYINVIKGCELRTSTDYTPDTGIVGLHKGTALQVFGVGFSENGTLRYKVNLNGQWGYVTANPKYTKATYLLAGQKADVIASTKIGEYNSPDFSADSKVKTLKAGTELTGTVIPMRDGNYDNQLVYGGFTRIKLDNGDYVTANTDWVAPAQHQNNNVAPAKQTNNNNNQQGPVVEFD